LKKGLSSNEVYIDVDDIKSALQTAETDTEKLNALIRELNSKEVTFSLKHSLEKLASLKQIKVAELKELIAKDALDIADQGKVIHELEEFEQKWIDLGKDIDILFKDAKK